jgi:hypothetical protein
MVFDNSHPKPVNLNEKFKERGLTEEEIKKLWKNIDEKINRKNILFWKKSNLFLESLVILFGLFGVLISLIFGYEVVVTATKKNNKKKY